MINPYPTPAFPPGPAVGGNVLYSPIPVEQQFPMLTEVPIAETGRVAVTELGRANDQDLFDALSINMHQNRARRIAAEASHASGHPLDESNPAWVAYLEDCRNSTSPFFALVGELSGRGLLNSRDDVDNMPNITDVDFQARIQRAGVSRLLSVLHESAVAKRQVFESLIATNEDARADAAVQVIVEYARTGLDGTDPSTIERRVQLHAWSNALIRSLYFGVPKQDWRRVISSRAMSVLYGDEDSENHRQQR